MTIKWAIVSNDKQVIIKIMKWSQKQYKLLYQKPIQLWIIIKESYDPCDLSQSCEASPKYAITHFEIIFAYNHNFWNRYKHSPALGTIWITRTKTRPTGQSQSDQCLTTDKWGRVWAQRQRLINKTLFSCVISMSNMAEEGQHWDSAVRSGAHVRGRGDWRGDSPSVELSDKWIEDRVRIVMVVESTLFRLLPPLLSQVK